MHPLANSELIFQAEMNALHQQEQELVAGKEQILDVLTRIEDEKVM